MVIDQMHLAVEFGFQKIAANQFENIQEEEIDLALNIAQDRFIKMRLGKQGSGFADTQRRLDDLREIIEKNYRLTAYIPRVTDSHYEEKVVYGLFPANYLFLVNDRSQVVSSVDKSCLHRPKASLITTPVNKAVVPFPYSTKEDCPFYTNLTFSLVANATDSSTPIVLFDSSLTGLRDGVEKVNDRAELIELLLEVLNRNTVGVTFYWERYEDTYYPDSFVLISENDIASPFFTVDEVTSTTNISFSVFTRQSYVLEQGWKIDYRPNRLTNPESLYDLVRHPFAKTRRNSPITSLAENRIYGYEGDDFIIAGFIIDYLRKPGRLSKRDNLSCELAAHTHQEICDLAIEYLQVSTGQPQYQLKVGDDINRGGN